MYIEVTKDDILYFDKILNVCKDTEDENYPTIKIIVRVGEGENARDNEYKFVYDDINEADKWYLYIRNFLVDLN